MLITYASRKATPMSEEPSVRTQFMTLPSCASHLGSPLATTGTGSTSAFGSAVVMPTLGLPVATAAFGPIVTPDARVRNAQQAAPPRGQRC